MSSKKGIRYWVGLGCIFLAGASAGSLGYCLGGMLTYGFGNIERHQAMLPDATGQQFAREQKHLIQMTLAVQFRPELDTPTIGEIEYAGLKSDPDRRIGSAGKFGTDHRELSVSDLKQVAYPHLDLAQLIAQHHIFWNGPGCRQKPAMPTSGRREPFTDARARLTRTRSENSVSNRLADGCLESPPAMRIEANQKLFPARSVFVASRKVWRFDTRDGRRVSAPWIREVEYALDFHAASVSVSNAVSPSCHATPGIGWRSPATRMTEARIPLALFVGRPGYPVLNSTAHWHSEPGNPANGGLSTIEEIL